MSRNVASQLLETFPIEEGEKKAKVGATQTIKGIGELRRKIKRNERDYETERRNKNKMSVLFFLILSIKIIINI